MASRKKKLGIWAHGCPVCGQRYEVGGALVVGPRGGVKGGAGESVPCKTCLTGEPLAWWPEARTPRDCCRQHSKPIKTVKEMEDLQLCPDYLWYRCPVCGRTHPRHDPTKETEDDAASRAQRARERFRAERVTTG